MVIEETWGVPLAQAQAFWKRQEDVSPWDGGYRFQSCRITLEEQSPGYLGKIAFPRTKLRIEGPEDQAKPIHRRFLIQFLSAGG